MRNNFVSHTFTLLLVASTLVIVPASADDTCPCKNQPCTFSLAQQRRQLADGYEAIAENPSIQVLGANGKPIDSFDEDKLPQKQFSRIYKQSASLKSEYERLEKQLFDRIPSAECGGKASVAAKTNPLTCEITGLKEAQNALPCPEMKDMIAKHEEYHRTQCFLRKHSGKLLPHLFLTPSGLAKEESAAYKQEIETISKLLEACCG